MRGSIIRLLVVEDNPGDVRLVREILSGAPVRTQAVERLEEALQYLRTEEYDAVLLDMGLPDSRGLDTVRALCAAAPAVPVVVLTGLDDDQMGRAAVHEGAQDYVTKGQVVGSHLVRSIRYAIERNEQRTRTADLARQLQAIRTVNQLIVREKSPQRLVQQACDLLVQSGCYEGAWIALLASGGTAATLAMAGDGRNHANVARVFREGQRPACCERALMSERGLSLQNAGTECGTCPLANDRCHHIGAVALLRHEKDRYGFLEIALPRGRALDESLILEVAEDIGFALHGIARDEERARTSAETAAMLEAKRAIDEDVELETALRSVLDGCRRLVGAGAAYLTLADGQGLGDEVIVAGAVASPAPSFAGGLFDEAAGGERARFEDGAGGLLAAPLKVERQPIGFFVLGDKPGGFDDRDAHLAERFGELVAVTVRDRRREAALRRSEETFRLVFGAVADGLVLSDLESGEVVLVNESMCRMLRTSEDGLLRASGLLCGFPLAQGGRDTGELLVTRPDGSTFHADVQQTEAEILGRRFVLGCFRDVTEQKKLHASLAQSDRLANMGLLAAGVAHEINNPLTYVLYSLETLSQDLRPAAEAMRRCHAELESSFGADAVRDLLGTEVSVFAPAMFEEMLDSARDALEGSARIREIVRSLGTFSRVEHVEVAPVHLNGAIDHAVAMATNEVKYRARLVKDLARLPPVLGSEGKLAQVFLNLIINAAHAIEEGNVEDNEIRIRTWSEGAHVFAEVRDTGRGIPEEHRPRLFEPFFTTKEVGVGSGLGLSICRNIITGFGGEIDLESEVGVGTRFVIRLPIAPREAEESRAHIGGPRSEPDALAGRILVVDDEPLVRSALTRMLGRRHQVVAVSSGEEARKLLETDPDFDVLLFDLMMPRMSGMDLHEWLTRHNPALAAEVVFMTGGAFTPRAQEYLESVGNLRVEKPFDTRLGKLISELLQASKSCRNA